MSENEKSTPKANLAVPVRRLSKDEQTSHRQWPREKHLASSHASPIPQPGQKNRIHSVLVALPFLMLMIGLYVYFKGESAQINGTHIVGSMIEREGLFKSTSKVAGIGKSRYYLWYTVEDRSRGVRVSESQKLALEALVEGDSLSLKMAPTVEGSKTLWIYSLSSESVQINAPLD